MVTFSGQNKAGVTSRLSPPGIWFHLFFFPDKHSLFYNGVPPGIHSHSCHVFYQWRLKEKTLLSTFLFDMSVETKELLVNIIAIRTDLLLPWFTFRHNYIKNATTKTVFDLVIRSPFINYKYHASQEVLRAWGPFLEGPEKFSHRENHCKISNLLITELFYSHILNVNWGSLHTRRFRCIHLSVYRYKLFKNGLKVAGAFEKQAPGPIIFNVTRHKILHNIYQHMLKFVLGPTSLNVQRKLEEIMEQKTGPNWKLKLKLNSL